MTDPTITFVMKGDTGSEIVNYGYVDHEGTEIRIKNGERLTTSMSEYAFPTETPDPPRSAWITFTNDGAVPGKDMNVIVGGLKYIDTDMLDPAHTYPPVDDWVSAGWGTSDVENGRNLASRGHFGWGGTYRMDFDLSKRVHSTNPTITFFMKGDTGSEIVNYGYVDHKGTEIRIKNDLRLTTTPTEYAFHTIEPNPPRSAWITFANDGAVPGKDMNVIVSGLRYGLRDMLDPEYVHPPVATWRSAGWGESDVKNGLDLAKRGHFGWGGTYRMEFDPSKLPPPPPPGSNPPPPPPGTPPGTPPPGSPSQSSSVWNPLSNGFFSLSNIGMWTYLGLLILVSILIFFFVT